MIRPNLILDLNDELFVDNFAGGGGASTGIEWALGRHVDHAINHNAAALGMHRINHPQTIHHCEDVFDVDPLRLTGGRRVGAGWFSPDCKHFSKAKGGKPLSKKIRGLPFVMLRWAKIRVRVLYMENVEEIQTWGPLLENGKPDPKHKGRTWRAFLDCLGSGIAADSEDLAEILEVLGDSVTKAELLQGFGYEVQTRELRACDYGAPTIRRRLFLIARCDGMPIVWPEPTHYDPKAKVKNPNAKNLKPWVPVATCIDWDIPCHSIFLTREQAKAVRCRRPLVTSTLRRVATGIDRFVLKAQKPFLVSLTHQGSDRVEPMDQPINTITGAHRGEKAVVVPHLERFQGDHPGRNDGAARNQSMADPVSTQDTSNRFCRVDAKLAPFLTEHANSSNQRSTSMDKPSPTITAETKRGSWAAVGATIISKHTKDKPAAVDVPLGTASGRDSFALASALMIQKGHLKSNSKMVKSADEPMRCQTTRGEHGLIAASLTKFTTGSVGQSADKPLATITSGSHSPETHGGAASVHGLVAADIVKLRGTNVGHAVDEPAHTLSAGGTHQGVVQSKLVAPSLAAYYGNDQDGQAVDGPARTVTVRERFGLVESELVSPMTADQIAGARRVAEFLRSYGVVFEGEFATLMVDGVQFVIVDIGMRMLTARELFRAQGFGDEYIIDRAWLVNPKTGELIERKLTKEEQIRMCGNSVCPDVAEALVRANSADLAAWSREDRGRLGGRARRKAVMA